MGARAQTNRKPSRSYGKDAVMNAAMARKDGGKVAFLRKDGGKVEFNKAAERAEGGKVEGKKSGGRLDKFARGGKTGGGCDKSPFSSAASGKFET
jgi:hypothetical protein